MSLWNNLGHWKSSSSFSISFSLCSGSSSSFSISLSLGSGSSSSISGSLGRCRCSDVFSVFNSNLGMNWVACVSGHWVVGSSSGGWRSSGNWDRDSLADHGGFWNHAGNWNLNGIWSWLGCIRCVWWRAACLWVWGRAACLWVWWRADCWRIWHISWATTSSGRRSTLAGWVWSAHLRVSWKL